MNRLIAAAAAVCLATSASAASVLTQIVDFVGSADFSNAKGVDSNGAVLPFFFFDTTVGTLNSIEFSSSYSYVSTGTITARETSSGAVSTDSAAQFSSDDAGVTGVLNSVVNTIPTATVGGNTLAPVAYNLTGTSTGYDIVAGMTAVFGSTGNGSVGTVTVTDAASLAAFSRVGTFSYNPLITTRTGANVQQTSGSTSISQNAVLNGRLTIVYNVTPLTTDGPGAVPEPTTWAMMLGGFGLVGASLRRRRQGILAR